MALEIVAIICGTLAFIWVSMLVVATRFARSSQKRPIPPLNLDKYEFNEAVRQAIALFEGMNGK